MPSCPDGDVGVLAYVKVVVCHIVEVAFGDDDGDMHALVLDAGSDVDVDAFVVLFGFDADFGGGVANQPCSVFAYVETAFGNGVQFGYFF